LDESLLLSPIFPLLLPEVEGELGSEVPNNDDWVAAGCEDVAGFEAGLRAAFLLGAAFLGAAFLGADLFAAFLADFFAVFLAAFLGDLLAAFFALLLADFFPAFLADFFAAFFAFFAIAYFCFKVNPFRFFLKFRDELKFVYP
jgi:hypothetical protein